MHLATGLSMPIPPMINCQFELPLRGSSSHISARTDLPECCDKYWNPRSVSINLELPLTRPSRVQREDFRGRSQRAIVY
jgi:hypothetical protein